MPPTARTRDEYGQRHDWFAMAFLAWTGLLLQLWLSLGLAADDGKPHVYGLVAYLGYFTVLSNGLVAIASTLQWRGFPRSTPGRDSLRGCATTSIIMVAVVYHALLSALWSPQGWQWVADQLLHTLVPLGMVAAWLAFPPRVPPPRWAPLVWSLYPLAYLSYALLRGELLGTYPYPFIDVLQLGYERVLINALALWFCFLVLGFAVQATSVRRKR